MWRDRWLALGVIGAALACLACLPPFAVVALGAIVLGACSGHLDIVGLPVLATVIGLVIYRYCVACQRAQ